MSWMEIEDVVFGRVVVELQPTVLEIFQARVSETTRIHLRMLAIDLQGPNGQGHQRARVGIAGGPGVTLTVAEPQWARLWPLLEQARQAQVPFGYAGY